MPRAPRNGIAKRLIGRNVAAFHIARERVLQMTIEDRRRLVQRALKSLAEDDVARQSDEVFDEARKILVELMNKR